MLQKQPDSRIWIIYFHRFSVGWVDLTVILKQEYLQAAIVCRRFCMPFSSTSWVQQTSCGRNRNVAGLSNLLVRTSILSNSALAFSHRTSWSWPQGQEQEIHLTLMRQLKNWEQVIWYTTYFNFIFNNPSYFNSCFPDWDFWCSQVYRLIPTSGHCL